MGRKPRQLIRNAAQEAERFRLRAAVGFLAVAVALVMLQRQNAASVAD